MRGEWMLKKLRPGLVMRYDVMVNDANVITYRMLGSSGKNRYFRRPVLIRNKSTKSSSPIIALSSTTGFTSSRSFVGIAAISAAGLTLVAMNMDVQDEIMMTSTVCEAKMEDTAMNTTSETTTQLNDVDVEEEDDPYANLPEEDEPTTCSICQTFRQGPCRPYWRRNERCVKDHAHEKDGHEKCERYSIPFIRCIQEYSNIYGLIDLELDQNYFNYWCKKFKDHERRSWSPIIDWDLWSNFVQEQGLDFRETDPEKKYNLENELQPLWKRVHDNVKNPVLISASASIPKEQPISLSSLKDETRATEDDGSLMFEVAWAVDQDGFVLGTTRSTEYMHLMRRAFFNEEEEGEATKSDDDGKDDEEGSTTKDKKTTKTADDGIDGEESTTKGEDTSTDDSFTLHFTILPGETKYVRICAVYAENPLKGASAGKKWETLYAQFYEAEGRDVEKVVQK